MEKSRIGGICDQPNQLAAFFCYYMFLILGFFLMNMNRAKFWLLLVPFLICFRGIMVTFSRGGYLAFALGLYAIVFFKNKLMFFFLIIMTWLLILNPIFLPSGIRYRMSQTFTGGEQSSYSSVEESEENLEASSKGRVEIWRAGMQMVQDYPIFGVGYGLFPVMLKMYWNGGERDAHNTYLIIAGEMGIPTLIVFLVILWIMIWNTYSLYKTTDDRFSKATALGFLGGLFGLLLSNMFGSRLDSQEVSSWLWILAALIVRLKILDDRAHNRKKPVKIGYRLETA